MGAEVPPRAGIDADIAVFLVRAWPDAARPPAPAVPRAAFRL